jgi:hypothetical protein
MFLTEYIDVDLQLGKDENHVIIRKLSSGGTKDSDARVYKHGRVQLDSWKSKSNV